jgi:glycyl-tRNA synthetase beta chain
MEVDEVADAVRDHYKPVGPSDSVPTAPVTVAVALADKLDTLVGFFAIDERPTGSRDPFALRRAALGVIRLLTASNTRLGLEQAVRLRMEAGWLTDVNTAADRFRQTIFEQYRAGETSKIEMEIARSEYPDIYRVLDVRAGEPASIPSQVTDAAEVLVGAYAQRYAHSGGQTIGWVAHHIRAFFADRLKVVLREEGKRHDLVDAVFALGDDDLVRIVRRVEALDGFLHTEDGASLLAGYKRATNILKAEAKKAPEEDYRLNPDLGLMTLPEEQALAASLRTVEGGVDQALEAEDFDGAMRRLSQLRAPVDRFFDKVLVNDADPAVRLNRLRLLADVRDTANRVADFSLVSG